MENDDTKQPPEAPEAPEPATTEPAPKSGIVDVTAQNKGKAFQIIGVSGKHP